MDRWKGVRHPNSSCGNADKLIGMEKFKSTIVGGVFVIVSMALTLSSSVRAQDKDTQVFPNPYRNDINQVKTLGTQPAAEENKVDPEEERKKREEEERKKREEEERKKREEEERRKKEEQEQQKKKAEQGQQIPADKDAENNKQGQPKKKKQKDATQKGKSGGKRLATQGAQTGALGAEEEQTDDMGFPRGGSCEDEALRTIFETVLKNKKGIDVLAEMFELTSLRLAKRAADGGKTTVEDRLKADIQLVQSHLEDKPESKAIREAVGQIYTAYGLPGDSTYVQKQLNALAVRGKDACYFARNLRMNNAHTSAYVLAVAVGEKDSGLGEIDAATIFVVEKLRAAAGKKYAYGTFNGNMMNATTRASRALGRIENGKSMTVEELKKDLQEREAKLEEVFKAAAKEAEKGLQECIARETNNCATCVAERTEKWNKSNQNVAELKKGLLKAVAKSDRIKMIEGLEGKIGKVTFNFGNYVVGAVPADKRRGKVDACDRPLKGKGSSQTGPTQGVQTSSTIHVGDPKDDQAQTHDFMNGEFQQQKHAADATYVAPSAAVQMAKAGGPAHMTAEEAARYNVLKSEFDQLAEVWKRDNTKLESESPWFYFEPTEFEAWKKRLETWRKNHPDRQPPPVDPTKKIFLKDVLNFYLVTNPYCISTEQMKTRPECKGKQISDLHCRGADLYGGEKLLVGAFKDKKGRSRGYDYRFATPADCEKVVRDFGKLHYPH